MYISSSGAQHPQKLFLLIMSCREALRDMRPAGNSHFLKSIHGIYQLKETEKLKFRAPALRRNEF